MSSMPVILAANVKVPSSSILMHFTSGTYVYQSFINFYVFHRFTIAPAHFCLRSNSYQCFPICSECKDRNVRIIEHINRTHEITLFSFIFLTEMSPYLSTLHSYIGQLWYIIIVCVWSILYTVTFNYYVYMYLFILCSLLYLNFFHQGGRQKWLC